MPEPAWLQEIRDRVNAATKGPWMLTSSILGDSLVVLANDEETGVLFPSQVVAHIPGGKRAVDTGQFIAAAVDDVPRLLGLVEGMAEALDVASEHFDPLVGMYGRMPGQCRVCGDLTHTKCLTICRHCANEIVQAARAKYHGEVESND
jgi:hypothetical protein